MAQMILINSAGNQVIHGTGKANLIKNSYLQWFTTDGSTSICTIQNPGVSNTVTLVVSGAPATIVTTDGKPFNGQHQIPPNNPTVNITAIGDFLGTQVTIFNMSALKAKCSIRTVTP